MTEREYLSTQLEELRKIRGELPGKYDAASKQVEQQIEQLMEKAGILSVVRQLRSDLSKYRDTLQKQADFTGVRIEVMEFLFDKYHRDPVKPGEKLYGIDISKLDWQTRLMVKNGNLQTIQVLGGDVAEALVAFQKTSVEDQEELDTIGDIVTPAEVFVSDEKTDEEFLEQT